MHISEGFRRALETEVRRLLEQQLPLPRGDRAKANAIRQAKNLFIQARNAARQGDGQKAMGHAQKAHTTLVRQGIGGSGSHMAKMMRAALDAHHRDDAERMAFVLHGLASGLGTLRY